MANNNEIKTGKMNSGEFTVSYQTNGYGGVIPIIDGTPHPELLMGYVSDADREAGLKLLAEALKATAGNIPEAMRYMYNAAMTAAKEIKADDAVTVDGHLVIIDYNARKAYAANGSDELANLDDMTCELPREAIKAILVERAKPRIAELEALFDHEEAWMEDDDYWDDDDNEEFDYSDYYED